MKIPIFSPSGLLVTALIMTLAQHSVAQNLVVNGSFDTDASGWNSANVGSSGGWISLGNPSGSFLLQNSQLGTNPPASPTINQTITGLLPGASYLVSGEYQLQTGKIGEGMITLGVALDGVYQFLAVGTPYTDHSWYGFSFLYTPSSPSATLSLSGRLNGSDYNYSVDNIFMGIVPEPTTASLFLSGMVILRLSRKFAARRRD